jgi:hypothetical protein
MGHDPALTVEAVDTNGVATMMPNLEIVFFTRNIHNPGYPGLLISSLPL